MPVWSEVRGVIIDLDGTMLDTAPDFHAAVTRMRADLGLAPLALSVVTDFIGKGPENLVRQVLLRDLGERQAESLLGTAWASYQRHYAAINGEHARAYPGVRDGLRAMRARQLPLACVTNKPFALASQLLVKSGLSHYFDIVYGGDSLPHKKPHPGPLLQVCEDWALAPAQVVLIGDSSNDAQAARAAGCPVLTVPYGYNHGEPVASIDTDAIVASLAEAALLLPWLAAQGVA